MNNNTSLVIISAMIILGVTVLICFTKNPVFLLGFLALSFPFDYYQKQNNNQKKDG